MSDSEAVRMDTGAMAAEELPSLSDFYEEPGGVIAPGWYKAQVLEGYATGKGTQFTTSDEPAKEGRRAFRLCFGVNVGQRVVNLQKTFFYEADAFAPQNLARIKELRETFRSTRGAWPGQGRAQNFSITLGNLSQLEKAIGFKLARHPRGGLHATPYIGKALDVRIGTDKKGYNDVTAFAPAGTRAK